MAKHCSQATLDRSGTLTLLFPEKEVESCSEAKWLVNGFPVTVTTWTQDQWLALDEQPNDAQKVGRTWVALRVD